jgi:hypothetical protein
VPLRTDASHGLPGQQGSTPSRTGGGIEAHHPNEEWVEFLKARGWEDYSLAGEPFTAFLKEEQIRVGEILNAVGLVKS